MCGVDFSAVFLFFFFFLLSLLLFVVLWGGKTAQTFMQNRGRVVGGGRCGRKKRISDAGGGREGGDTVSLLCAISPISPSFEKFCIFFELKLTHFFGGVNIHFYCYSPPHFFIPHVSNTREGQAKIICFFRDFFCFFLK